MMELRSSGFMANNKHYLLSHLDGLLLVYFFIFNVFIPDAPHVCRGLERSEEVSDPL